MTRIRQILESEILRLKNISPEDWHLDIPRLFYFHYGHPYFYPVAAEREGRIVGCGIAILQAEVGWLGTIIVLPEYRRQGIGQKITSHLIEYCREKGCTSLLLTASEMGEPIYRRLGFETHATYVFYKRDSLVPARKVPHVRELRREDYRAVKSLDREATGEDRSVFLERFLSTGRVYSFGTSSDPAGFYFPDFGGGLIIAHTPEAGCALMKERLNRGKTTAVVPETNSIAREVLISEGFQEYRTSPRMVLGRAVPWEPAKIFNRATGYCG